MSRKIRFLLVAVIALGWLGVRFLWQSPADTAPATGTATSPAVTATAAPVKPRKLGRIAFTPCQLSPDFGGTRLEAQCATLSVPEDRRQPNGRKLALNLAWLPATGTGRLAPDPVFFLAGGPGQSAVDTYPGLDPVFTEVRKHRHVVLVDQRGTGKSNLLTCPLLDEDNNEASTERLQALTRACMASLSQHADLRHYTTTDAIADLEAVREAIGAAQLNLVGVSYGTRVAQQYAMRYPAATRSVVLDSVVPNTLQLGNIFARNLDDALALQFALCAKAPACQGKLGDPRKALDTLLAKLRAAPIPVTYRDATSGEQITGQLTADGVAGLVRMYAYMPIASALLPKLIHEASLGRYDGLMALSSMMQQDMTRQMAIGMQMSVVCSEDHESMVARTEDAGTVLGNRMSEGMAAICSLWPKGTVPADFNRALATKVPALVLAGEFDPVTPPRYGEEVVKSLPNGRLFVLRGQGHNVIGAGCMPKLFTQFIEKADAKALDGHCLDSLNYAAPFTSFNGAEP